MKEKLKREGGGREKGSAAFFFSFFHYALRFLSEACDWFAPLFFFYYALRFLTK